jgi:hypothetical protein
MINEVTIEGFVTREPWFYDKDVFFRIAAYRDIDLPSKPDMNIPGRDEADYVNVRYPNGKVTLFSVQKGQQIRVHGFLQSREFKENLAEFMEKANKNVDIKLADDLKPERVAIERNIVEVVAMRVIAIELGNRKKGQEESYPSITG